MSTTLPASSGNVSGVELTQTAPVQSGAVRPRSESAGADNNGAHAHARVSTAQRRRAAAAPVPVSDFGTRCTGVTVGHEPGNVHSAPHGLLDDKRISYSEGIHWHTSLATTRRFDVATA